MHSGLPEVVLTSPSPVRGSTTLITLGNEIDGSDSLVTGVIFASNFHLRPDK